MNRTIRFLLDADPTSGRVRLSVPRNCVNEREHRQLQAELLPAYDRLVRQHSKTVRLRTLLRCVPPEARFRVYVRPGSDERLPMVVLESKGLIVANGEQTPPWQQGFLYEIEELISWAYLHDQTSDPDELRAALRELNRIRRESPQALFSVLLTSYLLLARTLRKPNDRKQGDRYSGALRGVDQFFRTLVAKEVTTKRCSKFNEPANNGGVIEWLKHHLRVSEQTGPAAPPAEKPPQRFFVPDRIDSSLNTTRTCDRPTPFSW